MDSHDLIRIFVTRDGGQSLENYEDRQFKDFHGELPQIGDHIAHTPDWVGQPGDTDGNLFFVVTGRFFMSVGIALVCELRAATAEEFELF